MRIFKKALSIALRVSISIVLLIFLFNHVDRKSLFEILKHANKTLLFVACCVFGGSYILCLLRWELLLKAIDIKLPIKRVLISFSGGIFFSLFLPSTIGGDLMRSLDLAAHTKKPREVVATVLLDRLSGYVGLVILALSSLFFGWRLVEDKSVLLAVVIISAVLICILLVFFNEFIYTKISSFLYSSRAGRAGQLFKNLYQEIHIFRGHKKTIIEALFFSLIIQVISPLTFSIIALALGLKINNAYLFIFLPIINAITLLPISIGGLGLRDATTIFFFSKAGVGKDLAFAMSLINFSFILIYGILGGLIYVFTVHHRRIQYHKPLPIHSQEQL